MESEFPIAEFTRSRRRSLCLQINNSGKLIIKAPNRLSQREIETFIAEKRSWILKQLAKLQKYPPLTLPTEYLPGAKIPYLGHYHKLLIIDTASEPLSFNSYFFLDKNYLMQAEEIFSSWYRQKAKYLLTDLVQRHAAQYQLNYGSIRISSAKATLGSCNRNGNLNFSWRLLLMPPPVIEYIVIHELAHLIHHNHSQAFWRQVAKMMPNYKEQELWLKNNYR